MCYDCFITTRPELARPATTLYQHNLTGILETAVRATNAQFDNPEILKRLDVRLLEVCCIMVTLAWNIPLCVCTHAGIYFVCVYEYISPLPYHWSVLWIIQRSFNKSSYFPFPCLFVFQDVGLQPLTIQGWLTEIYAGGLDLRFSKQLLLLLLLQELGQEGAGWGVCLLAFS